MAVGAVGQEDVELVELVSELLLEQGGEDAGAAAPASSMRRMASRSYASGEAEGTSGLASGRPM